MRSILALLACILAMSMGGMVGGASSMDISEPRLQEVVQAVTPAFEASAQAQGRNGMISSVEVVEAKKQVVAGMNYFVKVHLGDGEYAHLRIYDHFGDVELASVQLFKTKDDALEYFA